MTILAVYREPFSLAPRVAYLPEGQTVANLVASMRGLPDAFAALGVVCINGHPVPRGVWHMVKPKPLCNGVPVEVTFHAPIMGGGGGEGGKNPLATIASIAITIAAGWVASGGLGALLGVSFLASGTIGATLAAAAVSYAGSLLVSALIPPPVAEDSDTNRQLGTASASGNLIQPNGAIPRVVGTHKVFPPMMAEPFTFYEGDDEVVEALFGLAGPHELADIRINNVPIGDLDDVTYQTREGWPGDYRVTLIDRYTRTEAVQSEMRGHSVDESDGTRLSSTTGDIADALPQPRNVVTRSEPDEHQLQINFPGGLNENSDDTVKVRVPMRLAIREVGTETWTDLPEMHYMASNLRQLRATIRLIWTADATYTSSAATNEGFVEARIAAPAQAATPTGDAFAADSYFDAGSGDDYLDASNTGGSAVAHVQLSRYEAVILLDTATFPKGRYEIKLTRGFAFLDTDYTASSYEIDGATRNLFGYEDAGNPSIAQSRDGLVDTLYMARSVSIWNEVPAPTDDCAMIAIRGRNQSLTQVSTVASGYVPDWDGSAWTDWTTTSNPAAHLRDVLAGMLSAKRVPADLMDDAGLAAWRTACASAGYEVNAILEDKSMEDAARIIASTGFARVRMSETWGVVRDYDRSAETPVQIFSPRNSNAFGWQKAFADPPDQFLVSFADSDRDYETRQITVQRPGGAGELIEQVTYEGLVTEDEVRARAIYDFGTALHRSTFYSLEAPAEAIVCQRGSLVGVQHDMLTSQAGHARVAGVTVNDAGAVTAITLDDSVPVSDEEYVEDVTNFELVADVSQLGRKSGVALRRTDGTITTHQVSNATGSADVLTFATPIALAGLKPDVLATVGNIGREYGRFIVFGMKPKTDVTFQMTLIDEAPAMWA